MADVRYVLGLDPGPTESALVVYDAEERRVDYHVRQSVASLRTETLPMLAAQPHLQPLRDMAMLVIETPHARGGIERQAVMDTCIEVGRVLEVWRRLGPVPDHLWRETVKRALLGRCSGNDAQVRAALLDRWGGDSARGSKRAPGPLYGLRGDEWAALAVAVAWADIHIAGHRPEGGAK